MKVEYINPFISATVSVFAKLLSCHLKRGEIYIKRSFQPEYQASGVIGLSGKATGTVALTLDRNVALQATDALLGERFEEINAEVADTVGELTNMIAGAAKAQLEDLELNMGLPSVVLGKNHIIQFPSNAVPLCIPFDSPWGPLCLQVSLVDHQRPAEHLPEGTLAAAGIG
jgi:chemotaxis protein CheX